MSESTVLTEPDTSVYPTPPGQWTNSSSGMTVREHFASLALQALLTKHGSGHLHEFGPMETAWQRADRERESGLTEYDRQLREIGVQQIVLNREALAREAVMMADALIDALNASDAETKCLTTPCEA